MFLYSFCGFLFGIDLFCMYNKIVIVYVKKVIGYVDFLVCIKMGFWL